MTNKPINRNKAKLGEEQCLSQDPEHPKLQCEKYRGHPLNYHEAVDTDIHTWIDPNMRWTNDKPPMRDPRLSREDPNASPNVPQALEASTEGATEYDIQIL